VTVVRGGRARGRRLLGGVTRLVGVTAPFGNRRLTMSGSDVRVLAVGTAAVFLLAGVSPSPTIASTPRATLNAFVDDEAPAGGDGSSRAPFRAIGEAVAAARTASANYRIVRIHVAPGSYAVDSTLRLDFPVALVGSSVPELDQDGWPLGTAAIGTETTLTGTETLGTDPLIRAGGDAGKVVSGISVTKLTLRAWSSTGASANAGPVLQVQRAQDVVVANNILKAPGLTGIDAVASSGRFSGNHVSGMSACGICVGAGTADSPAAVTVTGNRSVSNGAGGLLLGGTTFPLLESGDILTADILHNDLSSHASVPLGFGLRVLAIGGDLPDSQDRGTVTARIHDNRIAGNRRGLIVDAGFTRRYTALGACDPHEYTGVLNLSLRGNTVTGSLSRSALVTFTRVQAITVGTGGSAPTRWRYLHGATFTIDDPDLSLADYELDDPLTDPKADPACEADTANPLLANVFAYNGGL
jgi:hypothetical protein